MNSPATRPVTRIRAVPLMFNIPPTRSARIISFGIAMIAAAPLQVINENKKLYAKLLIVFLYGMKNPTNAPKGAM